MGVGDQLMATGMARGASKRGVRIAFGNGSRIIWDKHSEQIFRNNPNIAPPGSERRGGIEWLGYFKSSRIYNRLSDDGARWNWNYDFRAPRGEFFFNPGEMARGKKHGAGFILIEPEVERWKSSAANKDWGRERYQEVASALRSLGHEVKQFSFPGRGLPLSGVNPVATRNFREAAAYMANASLYIGPEGGLHHAAAALQLKAVVIFGGFVPPQVTGYDDQISLTGGAEACGSLKPCAHCRAALEKISPDEVLAAAIDELRSAA